jgi:hypothetical protein
MDIKNSIFCRITPRSPLKVNLRFEGACRLHVQNLFYVDFLLGLFPYLEDGGDIFLEDVGWIFTN